MIKLIFEIHGSPMDEGGVATRGDVEFHNSSNDEILWAGVIQAVLDSFTKKGSFYESPFKDDEIANIRKEDRMNYLALQSYRNSLN